MMILVFCQHPGLNVAGVSHPRFAAHLVTAFSEAQLRELIAEPAIHVAVGHELAASDVSAFVAEHAPARRGGKPSAPS